MGNQRRLQVSEIFLGTMVNSKSVTVTCLELHGTELGSAGEVVFMSYTIVPGCLRPSSFAVDSSWRGYSQVSEVLFPSTQTLTFSQERKKKDFSLKITASYLLCCRQAKVMFGLQLIKSSLTGGPWPWSSEVNNKVAAAAAGPSFQPTTPAFWFGSPSSGAPPHQMRSSISICWLITCVNVASPWCPEVWSNTSLDMAVKVLI